MRMAPMSRSQRGIHVSNKKGENGGGDDEANMRGLVNEPLSHQRGK